MDGLNVCRPTTTVGTEDFPRLLGKVVGKAVDVVVLGIQLTS